MSRTTRAVPLWAKRAWEGKPDNYNKPNVGHDINRNRWLNGYDRRYSKDIGEPNGDFPKGYDRWEEVWGPGRKRHAKKYTARLMRNRGINIIRKEVLDLEVQD